MRAVRAITILIMIAICGLLMSVSQCPERGKVKCRCPESTQVINNPLDRSGTAWRLVGFYDQDFPLWPLDYTIYQPCYDVFITSSPNWSSYCQKPSRKEFVVYTFKNNTLEMTHVGYSAQKGTIKAYYQFEMKGTRSGSMAITIYPNDNKNQQGEQSNWGQWIPEHLKLEGLYLDADWQITGEGYDTHMSMVFYTKRGAMMAKYNFIMHTGGSCIYDQDVYVTDSNDGCGDACQSNCK